MFHENENRREYSSGKNKGVKGLVALLMVATLSLVAEAGQRYVPSDYPTIQAAINASASTGDEVVVAPGTYHEAINFYGKAVRLRSSDGAAMTTIDATGLNRSVVTCASGEGPGTFLDGFTITGGSTTSYGGGMFNNSSSPTLSNCIFTRNTASWAGGGMYNNSGSPSLTNCTFRSNSSSSGGGVYSIFSGSLTLSNCTFISNSGSNGGGLYLAGGSPTLTNCVFSGNSVGNYGAGMYHSASNARLINCTFSDNQGVMGGGGMFNNGAPISLTNCSFSGNRTEYIGAAIFDPNPPGISSLTNCIFSGNYSRYTGGAIHSIGGHTLTNCTFSGNRVTAGGAGGAMHNASRISTLKNCILWGDVASTAPELSPVTWGPQVSYSCVQGGWPGSGNINTDPQFLGGPSGTWTAAAIYDPNSGQTTLTNSAGAFAPGALVGKFIRADLSSYAPGQYPIVANTATTIRVWGWGYLAYIGNGTAYQIYDYRLPGDSPCVDTGNNAAVPADSGDLDSDGNTTEPMPYDFDRNPRIVNGIVDMGAYERGTDNQPPAMVSCPAPQTVNCAAPEGTEVTLSASVSDADGDALTVSWRVDGVEHIDSVPAGGPPTTAQVTLTRIYAPGTHIVQVTVSDGKASPASCGSGISVLVVDRQAPTFTCPGEFTISADGNCQATVPDVTGSVNANDDCTPTGLLTITQDPPAGTPVDLGTHQVVITVRDAAGNAASCDGLPLIVADRTPPVLSGQGADTTIECPATPGFTPPTASDACDPAPVVSVVSDVTMPGACAGAYSRTVTWQARDSSGNLSGTVSQTIMVQDTTPPTIGAPGADETIECPAAPVFTPPTTATDTCDAAPQIIEVDDVTTPDTCAGAYSRTKTWMAVDECGNESGTVSQTITVQDTTPPTIAGAADATIECPAAPTFMLPTATDTCDAAPQIIEVSDVTTPAACAGAYSRTKTWKAVDACGNESGTVSQTITVQDTTPPTITISGPESGALYRVGDPVGFSGTASDNCGMGSAVWQFTSNLRNIPVDATIDAYGAVTAEHTFTEPGVYAVQLAGRDACSNGSTVANTVGGPDGLPALVVVYDPSAGFVTGGGWIDSPAGAYVPDPLLTGRASFGFVARYRKGANVPDGNTEFQFRAGNLNFHSTSYEWLVVAGARAQFRGSGTINGQGDYRFMLTAIDGQVNGGGGTDKFRIRIWDASGLVYDNQMNAPDGADPTTLIGGGSIVIHSQ